MTTKRSRSASAGRSSMMLIGYSVVINPSVEAQAGIILNAQQ